MPAWIHATKDGDPVALFEDSGIPDCDYDDGVCGMAIPQTAKITNGPTAGSEVLEPLVCRTQEFTYPTDEVTVRVDSGG